MTGLCPFHQEKTRVVQRLAGQAGLLLLRLRQGRRRHHVPPRARAPVVRRGGRAAGAAGRRDAPLRGRLAGRASRGRSAASALYQGERGGRASCSRDAARRARGGGRARLRHGARASRPSPLERFGIGYAPGYPDFLLRRLTRATSSPEILLEAGLATRGDDGSVRDRFRGRITFPIHDLQGRGIGFGARDPADRRARERAGEVPQHRRDADLPKHEVLYNLHRRAAGGRAQPARSSWSRATPT